MSPPLEARAVRRVAFSLGSNLGDKQAMIERALETLFGPDGIAFIAASSFYRTAPWGPVEQDWFVNVCALGETDLAPGEILSLAKSIERKLGRTATVRWGPRSIDIDILWLAGEVVHDDGLVIPHREMFNRAFVLVPLAEICPDLVIAGIPIADAAAAHRDIEKIAPPWTYAPGQSPDGATGSRR